MNLATRCPSCGTVFRVGEEHLLASDGWVRCGRCDGVFNASEVLFDIDTGTPLRLAAAPPEPDRDATSDRAPDAAAQATQWSAGGTSAAGVSRRAPTPREAPVAPRLALQDLPDLQELRSLSRPAPLTDLPDLPDGVLLRAPSRSSDDVPSEALEPIFISDHVPRPAPPPPAALQTGPAGAQAAATTADASDPVAGPLDPLRADPSPAATAPSPAALPASGPLPGTTAPQAQATPSFLRQAERSRLWRHPAARTGGWAAVVLLALALPLQAALLWRDSLAAHLPAAQPALQALCRVAGCQVQPLRRIHQLSVASSGLNRLEGSGAYRLQLALLNRADTALALPAVDLTLTDPQGQLLARRVLHAADLGLRQSTLQAGQELPIQVLLSTGERRAAGYTVELFYP